MNAASVALSRECARYVDTPAFRQLSIDELLHLADAIVACSAESDLPEGMQQVIAAARQQYASAQAAPGAEGGATHGG